MQKHITQIKESLKSLPMQTAMLCIVLASFLGLSSTSHAKNNLTRLLQVSQIAGNRLTITPTVANKFYPSIGIFIPVNGTAPAGCIMFSNRYCLFSASSNAPATLDFGAGNPLLTSGIVCLKGDCELNCETYATTPPPDG